MLLVLNFKYFKSLKHYCEVGNITFFPTDPKTLRLTEQSICIELMGGKMDTEANLKGLILPNSVTMYQNI